MHVAITGSTGFIGTALVAALTEQGHEVTRIVRSPPSGPREVRWDIQRGEIDARALRGLDAVVHLAGEGIAEKRWSDAQKERILTSRTKGTRLIAEALASLDDGPRTLVSASAIGFYGDRGDQVLTEDSGPGEGFLADVVTRWEAAAAPAAKDGIRVVHPRIGIVQDPGGGALGKLVPLYKAGLGGRLGSGEQYWSWVSLADTVGIMVHALTTPELSGPVNAVAPHPVTNRAYTKILAGVLKRPAVLPVPELGPAIILGRELAHELLFTSARILPEKAQTSRYAFRHTDLERCLRDVLG